MEAALDPMEFRNAMARFASGVTIVTTRNGEGSFVGFTASAFSSLSLSPPLLLVCLQKDADCYRAFMEAPQFALSILAHGQHEIAVRFATKAVDKLQGTPVVPGPVTGLPLVEGASAHTECVTRERLEGGDHTILVGEVVRAASTDLEPLLHFNRQFGRFVAERPSK
jgi:flavin reductase ActVB